MQEHPAHNLPCARTKNAAGALTGDDHEVAVPKADKDLTVDLFGERGFQKQGFGDHRRCALHHKYLRPEDKVLVFVIEAMPGDLEEGLDLVEPPFRGADQSVTVHAVREPVDSRTTGDVREEVLGEASLMGEDVFEITDLAVSIVLA